MSDQDRGRDQAKAQYETLAEMVAALNCDYPRLEELRDLESGKHLDAAELEELAELEAAAGDCEDQDDARQRISEDPLSVEVRSGWASPGETLKAAEFCILLCTGGPAVRIIGELEQYGQPDRAWLEYQDWGTPWTRYYDADQDTLLAYAQQFYFGE